MEALILRVGLLGVLLTLVSTASIAQNNNWKVQYQTLRRSADRWIVSKNGKMAVLTTMGKPLTAFHYDTIYNFKDGLALVGIGERKVNRFNKVVQNRLYGYINQQGRQVIAVTHELDPTYANYREGIIALATETAHVWYNPQGEPLFSYGNLIMAESFHGGTAHVYTVGLGMKLPWKNNPRDVRDNYLDRQGHLLIPWKYDFLAPFQPGRLRVVGKSGKWGFLGETAQVKVPLIYDDIDADSAYYWQNWRRVGQQGKFGFLDESSGQLVLPLRYEASLPSNQMTNWVKKGNKWGLIDRQGRVISPMRYQQALTAGKIGRTIVKAKTGFGLADGRGRLLAPCEYDTIEGFQEQRAIMQYQEQYGYLDTSGREVIPPAFEQTSTFQGGKARVLTFWYIQEIGLQGQVLHQQLRPKWKQRIGLTVTAILLAIGSGIAIRSYRRKQNIL